MVIYTIIQKYLDAKRHLNVSNSPDKLSNSASNSNKLRTIKILIWLPKMQIIIPVYPAPPHTIKGLWSILIFEIMFPGATGFFFCINNLAASVISGIHSLEYKVMLDSRWICVSTLHFYILTFSFPACASLQKASHMLNHTVTSCAYIMLYKIQWLW